MLSCDSFSHEDRLMSEKSTDKRAAKGGTAKNGKKMGGKPAAAPKTGTTPTTKK